MRCLIQVIRIPLVRMYKSQKRDNYAVTIYIQTTDNIVQSMNSDGGRCHDNTRCESMWARIKEELSYSRGDKLENYTISELKPMILRYYMSYWANRRICTANGGLPPAVKRRIYYDHASIVAWYMFFGWGNSWDPIAFIPQSYWQRASMSMENRHQPTILKLIVNKLSRHKRCCLLLLRSHISGWGKFVKYYWQIHFI